MPSFGKKLSSDADRAGGVVRLGGRAQLRERASPSSPTRRRSPSASRAASRSASGRRSATSPTRRGPRRRSPCWRRTTRSITAVHADCHQISHWIGRAGLVYYKHDAGQALSHGAMTCNSGYYHGVLQVALAGLPRERGRQEVAASLQRAGREHRGVPALPVRPRPRARADDLQRRRPALVAAHLPQAADRLRPRLLHRRRVHAEPRHDDGHLALPQARRTRSTRATRSSSGTRSTAT